MSNPFATPWSLAHQAPLFMGSPRQEQWTRLPLPSPGDLPGGTEAVSLALADGFFNIEPPGKCIKILFVGFFLICWEFFQSSVQFSSVAQSCPTLCDPMNRSTPGLPVHHQLLEFTQTHVHRVGNAIQPSHPLSSPSPPAPNPSQC